jgi:transposase InsO family protein
LFIHRAYQNARSHHGIKLRFDYAWTDEGWLYLAVVLALYSRRVIGWTISEQMTATLVCDALIMALWHRKMPKGVIVYPDRSQAPSVRIYRSVLQSQTASFKTGLSQPGSF